MYLTKFSLPRKNSRAGYTLLEVLISTALLIMLAVVTTSGMIAHARASKSNYTMQKLGDQATRFINAVQAASVDADGGGFSLQTGVNNRTGAVLTITKTNESGAIVNLKEYAYIDRDNNPNTIGDNVIVERDENDPSATTGKVVLQYCSPIDNNTPIFSLVQGTRIPTIRVAVRTGDRTNPPSAADNTETGRGFQSFVVDTFIASLSVL